MSDTQKNAAIFVLVDAAEAMLKRATQVANNGSGTSWGPADAVQAVDVATRALAFAHSVCSNDDALYSRLHHKK